MITQREQMHRAALLNAWGSRTYLKPFIGKKTWQ